MEGSLSHTLGSELGSGCMSITSVTQHFLTGAPLVSRKQVCPNIACTSPTSTDLWGSPCARKRWQAIDSWLLRFSAQQEIWLDVSVIRPPSQQLWISREIKKQAPPHHTARLRPRLADSQAHILATIPDYAVSPQVLVGKRNNKQTY